VFGREIGEGLVFGNVCICERRSESNQGCHEKVGPS
jgi:hypothetical protein